MTTEERIRPDLESVFEGAVEDASMLLRAAAAYGDPEEEAPRDYLVLCALAARERCRAALALLENEASGLYALDLARLRNLAEMGAKGLEELCVRHASGISGLLSGPLARRCRDVSALAARLAELSRDAEENGQPEWALWERRDLALDILVRTAPLARAAESLGRNGLGALADREYRAAFERLMDVLAVNRGNLLAVAKDVVPLLLAREYGAPSPWLVLEEAAGPGESRNIAAAFAPVYQGARAKDICPGTWETSGALELENHLAACPSCAGFAMDVMAAQREAAAAPAVAPALPSELAAAIRSMGRTKRKAKKTGLLERLAALVPARGVFPKFAAGFSMAAAFFLLLLPGVLRYAGSPGQDPAVATAPEATRTPAASLALFGARTEGGVYRTAAWDREEVPLGRGAALASGEDFRVRVVPREDAHAYVLLHDSNGKVLKLHEGRVEKGRGLVLPDPDMWYTLDSHPGTERVYLLTSAKPVEGFDEKMEHLEWYGMGEMSRLMPEVRATQVSFTHR